MMLHANDDDIINILIDYITDNRYKQAILIDGKWGCGKTFFIKNKVLPKLNEKRLDISHSPFYYYALKGHLIKRPTFTEQTNHILFSQQTYYISLYGTKDLNEITNKIYLAVFEKFFEEKFGFSQTFIGKLNLFSKLLTFGIDILNQTNYLGFKINLKDLPSIKDIKNLNNIVLILDDIERCSLDINELLGFINNLTEHHNIKIILIANEEEIPHIKYLRDLPQKYDISLQLMNKFLQKDTSSSEYKKLIRDLEEKTKIIFPPDKFYKKIREKTIGLTIKYKVNFENIFNDIINKYVIIDKVKKLLNDSQQDIIKMFKNEDHHNIRTLIFSIISYEKIFNIIDKIEIDSSLNSYLLDEEKNILFYLISKSIKIKNGTYISDKSLRYKFVDDYLNNRYLNKETIIKQIKSTLEDKQKENIMFNKQEKSSFTELVNYHYLEDDKICSLLNKLKEELNDNIYSPNKFGQIIQVLIFLSKIGFKNIHYTEYIEPMKNQLKNNSYSNSNKLLDNLDSIKFDDKKDKEIYYTIIQSLIDIIHSNEQKNILEQYSFINNAKEWDTDFVQYCNSNIGLFMMNKAFFYYINVENLLKKIKNASLTEIYNLSSILRIIYINNNTYGYFKKDKVNLENFLDKLTNDSTLETNKITRNLALKDLTFYLKNVISKLDTLT